MFGYLHFIAQMQQQFGEGEADLRFLEVGELVSEEVHPAFCSVATIFAALALHGFAHGHTAQRWDVAFGGKIDDALDDI